jgi:hypothetical protein
MNDSEIALQVQQLLSDDSISHYECRSRLIDLMLDTDVDQVFALVPAGELRESIIEWLIGAGDWSEVFTIRAGTTMRGVPSETDRPRSPEKIFRIRQWLFEHGYISAEPICPKKP